MRSFVTTLLLLIGTSAAFAGPIEGEFFGYRIGSRYPVTDHTQGRLTAMGGLEILTEKPEKPADFQWVKIIATPKTFTIANIYGIAEFSDEKEAKSLATQYADLLSAAHGDKCRPIKAYLGEGLELLCGGQYELSVRYYASDKSEQKYKVHVGLKTDSESKNGKRVQAQFKHEMEQLEAEAKAYRLDKAKKEQKLRGLE